MTVRIFWVHAMKCMCAQTRPRFILLSERVFLGNGVWTHVNSKGKIPSTRKFPQRRIEPAMLWTANPNPTNELFRPPNSHSDSAIQHTCKSSLPEFMFKNTHTLQGISLNSVIMWWRASVKLNSSASSNIHMHTFPHALTLTHTHTHTRTHTHTHTHTRTHTYTHTRTCTHTHTHTDHPYVLSEFFIPFQTLWRAETIEDGRENDIKLSKRKPRHVPGIRTIVSAEHYECFFMDNNVYNLCQHLNNLNTSPGLFHTLDMFH